MKEKQEGEIMREAKGKERSWEKRGWERTCKSGNENIFNVGPLDGDIM